MSNEEMRNLNNIELKKEGKTMETMQTRQSEKNFTQDEIKQINKERNKLESLYYLGRLIKSIEGINIILERRMEFYKKYHLDLQEYVLWGRYLLTYRGTIQEIDQHYLCGTPVEITTLSDFMKSISSLRTKELVAFPPNCCICSECHRHITLDDVKDGNFELKINKFVHKFHKKTQH